MAFARSLTGKNQIDSAADKLVLDAIPKAKGAFNDSTSFRALSELSCRIDNLRGLFEFNLRLNGAPRARIKERPEKTLKVLLFASESLGVTLLSDTITNDKDLRALNVIAREIRVLSSDTTFDTIDLSTEISELKKGVPKYLQQYSDNYAASIYTIQRDLDQTFIE